MPVVSDHHDIAGQGHWHMSQLHLGAPNLLTGVDERAAVVEAAFDDIGEVEHAIPSTSADRSPLPSWLSGTPLLLMFALERIASHKSRRRRSRETTIEVVRPRST
jgi:hypothetical protein